MFGESIEFDDFFGFMAGSRPRRNLGLSPKPLGKLCGLVGIFLRWTLG